MITEIIKRDGRRVPFDESKIAEAIKKAFAATGFPQDEKAAAELAHEVSRRVEETIQDVPDVESIQDVVEQVLIDAGHVRTAKAYILYRANRSRVRQMNTRLMKIYEDITFKDAIDSDIKRENANIDGNTAMGSMLKYGSEGAKQFYFIAALPIVTQEKPSLPLNCLANESCAFAVMLTANMRMSIRIVFFIIILNVAE